MIPQPFPYGCLLELLVPRTLLPGHQPRKAGPCSVPGLWQGEEAPAVLKHISAALTLSSQLCPLETSALLLW